MSYQSSDVVAGTDARATDYNKLRADVTNHTNEGYGCKVYLGSNQNINNNSATQILFDTESYDPSGIHSGGTFTIPATGRYRFDFNVRVLANNAGARRAVVIKNEGGGSPVDLHDNYGPRADGSHDDTIQGSITDNFTVGDTLKVFITQTSGITLHAVSGIQRTYASLQQVGKEHA